MPVPSIVQTVTSVHDHVTHRNAHPSYEGLGPPRVPRGAGGGRRVFLGRGADAEEQQPLPGSEATVARLSGGRRGGHSAVLAGLLPGMARGARCWP